VFFVLPIFNFLARWARLLQLTVHPARTARQPLAAATTPAVETVRSAKDKHGKAL
jgi:hypothetical protein